MREASDFFKRAYLNGSVENQLVINIPDDNSGTVYQIFNDEIVSESMKLTQILCDDSDLKFGGCIASQFEIEVTKNIDLTGREISVWLYQTAVMPTYPGSQTYPNANDSNEIVTYPGFTMCKGYGGKSISLFKGMIYSCKLSKNRIIRKIVAYDNFYWIGTVNCTNWYRSLFENSSTITLGKLWEELLKKFKFRKAAAIENLTLPANDLLLYMTDDEVTVGEILRQIMEFSGCFCFIDGDGFLDFISFRDYNQLENYEIYHYYIDVETQDFTKTGYTGLYITGFDDGKGLYYFDSSSDENFYFLEDINIITKGYKASDFSSEFAKIDSSFKDYFMVISYDPINLKSEYRSWVELGDKIQVYVTWVDLEGEHTKMFNTMVLSRTLSGIQAITDEITSNAENIRYTEEYFDGD